MLGPDAANRRSQYLLPQQVRCAATSGRGRQLARVGGGDQDEDDLRMGCAELRLASIRSSPACGRRRDQVRSDSVGGDHRVGAELTSATGLYPGTPVDHLAGHLEGGLVAVDRPYSDRSAAGFPNGVDPRIVSCRRGNGKGRGHACVRVHRFHLRRLQPGSALWLWARNRSAAFGRLPPHSRIFACVILTSRREIASMCFSTARLVSTRLSAIAVLLFPSAIAASTSSSRGVSSEIGERSARV